MAQALSGAYVDIAIVSNYDQTDEAETIIGQTTEDIEVERDTETAEWNEHGTKQTQREELFETSDLTFSMIITDDQQNLMDAGIVDSSTGRIQTGVQHEAVYLKVFADETASSPAAVYEMIDVQFNYQNTSLPLDGIGMVEVAGWINGAHGYKQDY